MIYDIYNPTRGPRIIYNGIGEHQLEICIKPGEIKYAVELSPQIAAEFQARRNDLKITISRGMPAGVPNSIPVDVRVISMWGLGDCIHGRAVIRELMKTKRVGLESYYWALNQDLVASGMAMWMRRAPAPRIRETTQPPMLSKFHAPKTMSLTYRRHTTLALGSQLAAQFSSAGLPMPERPDFSFPVLPEWRDVARERLEGLNKQCKPIMVVRPIARNAIWRCDNRSPDPDANAILLAEIRNDYFVVSVADLTRKEWLVNPERAPMVKADLEYHRGELSFEELAGMFSIADLAFVNPGFSPIIAQAVGVPTVIVYGGNERFSTTHQVGQHLAPTLAIEPINPCGCHQGTTATHECDKRIDVEAQLPRLRAFVAEYGRRTCAA